MPAASHLAAQGLTGAAVEGFVVGADSAPIVGAIVQVMNVSTGERWETITRARARYFLEHLSIGGPYRITVRAIGFERAERSGVILSLGERYTANFSLEPALVGLPEIVVRGSSDPRINAARTGPAQVFAESTIARLPVPGPDRDYAQLALLSPQVALSPNGGLSFAGQHDRLNTFRIDGATNFGMGSPAGPALSPEALKELQVVTAPFDVRFGNFAGGLVNAVTKSGSNAFHGSVFGYFENQDLTGKDATGTRATAFDRKELGVTAGGPIVRDRVAFFASGGWNTRDTPQGIPEIGVDTVGVGIRYASAVRFQDILRNQYGVNAGDFSSAVVEAPTRNLFVKVTTQLGVNSRLDVSHGYVDRETRTGADFREYALYWFSSTFATEAATTHATRVTWTTALGRRFTNDLLLARLARDSHCRPAARYPLVFVLADSGEMVAGAQYQCLGVFDRRSSLELTDNLDLSLDRHLLTFGTHAQLIHLRDLVVNLPLGFWAFGSLDELEQGRAYLYGRDLPGPLRPEGPLGDFWVNQLALYAQDRWSITDRLSITTGLRLDVPYLPRVPTRNPEALNELGVNTAVTPSGNPLWSPRIGASYDPSGVGSTFIRGGIGLFAGPPAIFWLEQAYSKTGLEQVNLFCSDADVPAFTLDPASQPTACGASGPPSVPTVVYFDPSFDFPQNLKVSLGIDRRLPAAFIGTVDFLYTRGIHQFEERDANLLGPSGTATGEGGRVLYGPIDPGTGEAAPSRRSADFGQVIEIGNGRGDRSYSLTGQLHQRRSDGTELSVAYTFTDARDRIVPTADFAEGNLGRTPLDGTHASRNLRTSYWSRPHKVTALATVNLPLAVQLSLVYNGYSGRPVTYVVNGDANADGIGGLTGEFVRNDIVYVPRDASDISLQTPADFAKLDQYIESEPCLRHQRGRILARNSCREPWVNLTNARVAKNFPLRSGQSLQVGADLFNVLNLLHNRWGLVRQTTSDFAFFGNVQLLRLVGYDTANGRGIYRVLSPSRNHVVRDLSRWRLRLSARYVY